jgi:hypothetical protein
LPCDGTDEKAAFLVKEVNTIVDERHVSWRVNPKPASWNKPSQIRGEKAVIPNKVRKRAPRKLCQTAEPWMMRRKARNAVKVARRAEPSGLVLVAVGF